VVVIAFALIAARAAQLQLMSGDRYQRLTTAQTLKKVPIGAERGSIFDRNGRDLALSVRRSTIYADPTLVADPVGTAAKLAPVLGVDQDYLVKQLSLRPKRFAYLARTVADSVAVAVNDMRLPGIGFMPEPERSYPSGALAGSLLGHVGTDGFGLDGLEHVYEDQLSGSPGELVVEQDPSGRDIPNTERTSVAAQRGIDIVLTIDRDVQWEAEYALLDQIRATGAKGGMAAVVDVTTGDVLAMATVFGDTETEPARVAKPGERNGPITDLFAPGSTAKLITLSWALEHGKVTPDTMFDVKDYINVGGVATFKDAEGHPEERWSTADILRESSNVGTIQIADLMRKEEIANAVRAFGFGKKTTIEWSGDQPNGLVIPTDEYYATGKAATAIGYGYSVTGMQMLNAFVTIANDGVSRSPHLLGSTVDGNGTRYPYAAPDGKRVVSTGTAQTMNRLMQGVVGNGTGACAAIPGYSVAGKTGTSKKLLDHGEYSDATMASFIGFAPAERPRYAAMVVVDHPAQQFEFGGAAAAPVWSELMHFTLTKNLVPQTDAADAQYTAAQAIATYPCQVPHGADLDAAIAERIAAQAEAMNEPGTGDATEGATAAATGNLPRDTSTSE
jgi:cell division protein FtsI (penicillin-binding protein 3)